jgi:NADPH-dependent ferric siderophore reductase
VRVKVGSGARRRRGLVTALRTYSVWDYDGAVLQLCIMDHPCDGPGSRWARAVSPGQEVVLSRPAGTFTARPGRYQLFAGEETAAVAFGPMLRAKPASTPAYVVIEVDTPDDRLPMPAATTWCYRNGASAASSPVLPASVRALELPAEPGVAYVAGEARTVQAVRRHLTDERGWPRRAIITKPFWTPGRRGMH